MATRGKKSQKEDAQPETARIVPMYAETSNIEQQIKAHLESINSLVARLRPSERQVYFNGLYVQLLKQQMESMPKCAGYPSVDQGYDSLSQKELSLIRELSGHLQQLYTVTSGH